MYKVRQTRLNREPNACNKREAQFVVLLCSIVIRIKNIIDKSQINPSRPNQIPNRYTVCPEKTTGQ